MELPRGSRVHEAIKAAGGSTATADLDRLNLGRRRRRRPKDPRPGARQPGPGRACPRPLRRWRRHGTSGGTGTSGGAGPPAGKINLNTAGVEELATLPRVGPVLAQRIVDWRKQHGSFGSVRGTRRRRGGRPEAARSPVAAGAGLTWPQNSKRAAGRPSVTLPPEPLPAPRSPDRRPRRRPRPSAAPGCHSARTGVRAAGSVRDRLGRPGSPGPGSSARAGPGSSNRRRRRLATPVPTSGSCLPRCWSGRLRWLAPAGTAALAGLCAGLAAAALCCWRHGGRRRKPAARSLRATAAVALLLSCAAGGALGGGLGAAARRRGSRGSRRRCLSGGRDRCCRGAQTALRPGPFGAARTLGGTGHGSRS